VVGATTSFFFWNLTTLAYHRLSKHLVVVKFECSHLTVVMEAWKPASLKAMLPQSNMM